VDVNNPKRSAARRRFALIPIDRNEVIFERARARKSSAFLSMSEHRGWIVLIAAIVVLVGAILRFASM